MLAALAAATLPAFAQFKVVAPDGSVTYTDRLPAAPGAKVTPIGRAAPSRPEAASPADLPYELRQPAARFPVVLYATADCLPCDAARQWLQQRGIPYAERRVVTEADAVALERLVGWRTVPSATIGAQALRGFGESEWSAYVDLAGYPKASLLPRGWQPPPPQPLAPPQARTTPPTTIAAPETPAAEPVEPAPPDPSRPAIRF